MELKFKRELFLNKPGWITDTHFESFKEQDDENSPKGLKVRYLAIPFGKNGESLTSRNRAAYSRASLERILPLWQNLPVNVNHVIDAAGSEGLAVGHVQNAEINDRGLFLDLFIDACETKVIEKIKSGTARSCSIQVMADKVTEMVDEDEHPYQLVDVKEPLEISLVNVPGYRLASMEAILTEAFKAEDATTSNNPTSVVISKDKKMVEEEKKETSEPVDNSSNEFQTKVMEVLETLVSKVEELGSQKDNENQEVSAPVKTEQEPMPNGDGENEGEVSAEPMVEDEEEFKTMVINLFENIISRLNAIESSVSQTADNSTVNTEQVDTDKNKSEQNEEDEEEKKPEADTPVSESFKTVGYRPIVIGSSPLVSNREYSNFARSLISK